MIENKYFVPNIEDLCVGYEFEVKHDYYLYGPGKDTCPWSKCILKKNDLFADYDDYSFLELCILYLNSNHLRVPYLTKEQIEAEGWVLHGHGNDNGIVYSLFKNSFRVAIWKDSLKIEVEESEGNILFYGECKCINQFRKICKLLNIK